MKSTASIVTSRKASSIQSSASVADTCEPQTPGAASSSAYPAPAMSSQASSEGSGAESEADEAVPQYTGEQVGHVDSEDSDDDSDDEVVSLIPILDSGSSWQQRAIKLKQTQLDPTTFSAFLLSAAHANTLVGALVQQIVQGLATMVGAFQQFLSSVQRRVCL